MTEEQQATPGGDGPTSPVADPRQWRADEAHADVARWLEGDIGTACGDRWVQGESYDWSRARHLYPPRREGEPSPETVELVLEDVESVYGDRAGDMIDDVTGQPWVLVDREGRRYQVEIEATVRPLPPVETEIARYDAEVAAHRAMLARGRASITDPNRGRGRPIPGSNA